MVGRCDLLDRHPAATHPKVQALDFSKLLHRPQLTGVVGNTCRIAQDHGLDRGLDRTVLLKLCEPVLSEGKAVRYNLPIRNVQRVAGTMLGSEITRRFGAEGLPPDTVRLKFNGSAGQSFAAFTPRGMTFTLEGDANDYCGKGLSGARLIIFPPRIAVFAPEQNIIVGNVAFYGATGGEAFIRGMAGERFCVRNSGVTAVVEALGDHGCEYMTGGRVLVLGATGRNFAAGMSGGIAWVLDEDGRFPERCNTDMVDLDPLDDPVEIAEVRRLVETHQRLTGSARAATLLAAWEQTVQRFVKVYPKDFKRMQTALARASAAGLSGEEALVAAFEENARDLARVSGN